jgi:ABC-type branched-subunit amino acid transport system substrate-binding protein
LGASRAGRRISARARSAITRIERILRAELPLGRGPLLALNVVVLVAFSAVTVDALTRSGRVPAQGTLGGSVHQRHGGTGHASVGSAQGSLGEKSGSVVAQAGPSGRRLLAPGVVVSTPGRKHALRRPTSRTKPRSRKVPAKTTPGGLAASPIDMTVAYPAESTMVAVGEALNLHEAPGDTAAQARAMAHWVNANGGVGGHQLRLRLLTYDPAQGTGISAAFAPACAAAATGSKPLAVIAPLQDAEVESSCLASKNLLLVGDGPAAGDDQVYAKAGDSLFAPGSMSLNRIAREEVSYLASRKFLTSSSRVGIVRLDAPAFARASRDALRPALTAAGAHVMAEAVIPRPYAVTDVPSALAAARAAVVALRAVGVDRVVMLDAGVVAPLFMRVAQRQVYNPRYALNSTMAPARLVEQVPAAQLKGAMGVGFSPALDVAGADAPASQARSRCEQIYNGVDVGGSSISGRYSALALCGEMMTVRDALAGVTSPTTARLVGALESLTPPSVLALTGRLDGSHHDGAASVRPLAFDSDCSCMRYAGDERDSR